MSGSFVDAVNSRYGSQDNDQYDFKVADPNQGKPGGRVRKEKSWEMVGFEKTRQKQSDHSRLMVLGLSDANISCLESESGEMERLQLRRVTDLDLSSNPLPCISTVEKIVSRLPSLKELQLNDIRLPTGDGGKLAVASAFSQLTILTLNRTGTLWEELAPLNAVSIVKLHLEGNDIQRITPLQQNDQITCRFPCLEELNLAENRLSSWDDAAFAAALTQDCPALRQLNLAHNSLPPLPAEPQSELRALAQKIAGINLLDNSAIRGLSCMAQLAECFPTTTSFRINAEYAFANISEVLGRMLIIASIPQALTLNNAPVRPKERVNAELFYLQRALGVKTEGDDAAVEALRTNEYPAWQRLQEKHKNVVLSSSEPGAKMHILLEVTFRLLGSESVTKTIPSTLTVVKLKGLVASFFPGNPAVKDVSKQTLSFRMQDSGAIAAGNAIPLDDDLKDLAYFGLGSGAVVEVEVKE